MPPEEPDIDINRRDFIKGSLLLVGGLVLGKVSGLLSLPARMRSAAATISPPLGAPQVRVREYTNARYGFSLLHPSDLAVSTIDEGGGAATITFQNVEKAEGFQIFVVPHSESQVSEGRFSRDVPSGVRRSLTNIAIDGATGASFYSTHDALGDTHEVWVTRGGYLYELTTLKPLDRWLGSIVPTWKFL